MAKISNFTKRIHRLYNARNDRSSTELWRRKEKRNLLIKKYKILDDSELNDGYVYGGNITFNISDYINFPLFQGKYEVFVSRNNIESEHKLIEIIFNDK